MGLTSEIKRVVDQFDYNDVDINKGVSEFLGQMGTSTLCIVFSAYWLLCPAHMFLQTLAWRRTAPV